MNHIYCFEYWQNFSLPYMETRKSPVPSRMRQPLFYISGLQAGVHWFSVFITLNSIMGSYEQSKYTRRLFLTKYVGS